MPRVNWGQAAGEAMLLLIGVLAALAADAWWDERSERVEEREYLVALASELDQLRSHVSSVAEVAAEVEGAGRELLAVSAEWSRAPISADSLASLIATVSFDGEWSPPRAVYDDLVNTGAVGIIQSEEVRRVLNELNGLLDWVESRQVRHNAFFWTEMDPYFRRNLPVLAVWGWGSLPPPESWAPGDFVGSEEFRNLVAAKSLAALDVRDATEQVLEFVDHVSEVLNAAADAL